MDQIKRKSLDAQQLRSAEVKSPEVNAQPSNRKEQALDNLIDKKINKIPGYEVVKEKLRRARKPIILLDEFEKAKESEAQIKDLEVKLNQSLTNQELLFNLIKKLENRELGFCFEEDNELYLEDKSSKERIYLFSLDLTENKTSFYCSPRLEEVNDKFQEDFLKDQKEPIILLDECERKNSSRLTQETNQSLTKIQGILTSNLRTRTSTDIPYMAFLRLETADYKNHSLEECQAGKCKDCEIPVVFRIKETGLIFQDEDTRLEIKPNLSKGDRIILEGKWANSNGDRPSFTCYSYEVLTNHE